MKKYFIALAAIVFAAVACNKEVDNVQPIQKAKRHITVLTQTPETRTVLDDEHNALLWAPGDNFRLMTNTEETEHDAQTLEYVANGKFDAEVSDDATEAYAYYFAGDYTDKNHSTPTAYTAYIEYNQTQTKAGVLNGQMLPMAAKGTINEDNTVSLEFHQMAGVLALNIYSTEKVEGEVINSVTVTPSANTKFCGPKYATDLTQDNVIFEEGTSTDSKYSLIKVELGEPYDYAAAKPADKKMFDGQIYVVLAKQSYSAVKFEIETNKGTYEITSSGAPMDLTTNDFYPVNINLAKATFKRPATEYEWNLVTSASQVVPGSEVVIAAKDAAVAMSQTQNQNNRGQVAIAKTGTKISWEEGTAVQVFEVVAGSGSNTIAFKCSDGAQKGKYIYAASSSSNYLRSQDSVDENASWTVEIGSTGAATLKAQGNNSRNLLRYNSGSSCFSCYGSGQGDIVLYIKGEVADPDAKAIISNRTLEVAATGESADYEEAYTLINIDEDTETINLTASDNIIDPIALGGDVAFSMAPNYTSAKVMGNITLTLATDESVTATIPVEQKSSSLKVSATEVVIPADATAITFTVTSPEFNWGISADNTDVDFAESGTASESPVTVTVTSDIEATAEVQTIATLTVSRCENDPQAKTIYVKKAEKIDGEVIYYKKVSEITSGKTYLMVDGTQIFNGASVGQNTPGVPATITEDGIASNSTIDSYAVTITATSDGKYKVLLSTGKYLVINNSTTSNGNLTSSDAGEAITISVSGEYFRFISGNRPSRGIAYRAGTTNCFRNYAVSNFGSGEYGGDFDLYEYQGD